MAIHAAGSAVSAAGAYMLSAPTAANKIHHCQHYHNSYNGGYHHGSYHSFHTPFTAFSILFSGALTGAFLTRRYTAKAMIAREIAKVTASQA